MTDNTTIDVVAALAKSAQTIIDLKNAKALIEEPGRWTKRAYARLDNGHSVHASNPEATCWCSLGAIFRVTTVDSFSSTIDRFSSAAEYLREASHLMNSRYYPSTFNDLVSTTHRDVMSMYDLAIRLAEDAHSELSVTLGTTTQVVDAPNSPTSVTT